MEKAKENLTAAPAQEISDLLDIFMAFTFNHQAFDGDVLRERIARAKRGLAAPQTNAQGQCFFPAKYCQELRNAVCATDREIYDDKDLIAQPGKLLARIHELESALRGLAASSPHPQKFPNATPGPWEAVEVEEGYWSIYPVARNSTRVPIAVLNHSRDGYEPIRTLVTPDDARLIAASVNAYRGASSPQAKTQDELLWVIKQYMERDDSVAGLPPCCCDLCTDAKTALSKLTVASPSSPAREKVPKLRKFRSGQSSSQMGV